MSMDLSSAWETWLPISVDSCCAYKLINCPICKSGIAIKDADEHEDYIDELDEQCRLMTSDIDVAFTSLKNELRLLPSWKTIGTSIVNIITHFNHDASWSQLIPINYTNGSHISLFTHIINPYNPTNISAESTSQINLLIEMQFHVPMNIDFAIHVPPHQFLQHIRHIDKQLKKEDTPILLSIGETTITYENGHIEDNFTLCFRRPYFNTHLTSIELLHQFTHELTQYFNLIHTFVEHNQKLYDVMFHTYRRILSRGKLIDTSPPNFIPIIQLVADSRQIVQNLHNSIHTY